MSNNEVVLLNNLLDESKKTAPTGLSDSEYFELFALEQVLKDYDLSVDELAAGRVGGGNDGGIDGLVSFVDSEVLDEDTDLESVRRNPQLTLYVVQARSAQSFEETVFDRVCTTLRDILDLGKQREDLESVYSQPVVNRAMVFRDALVGLTARHASVRAIFAFVTKGSTGQVHPNVLNRAETLKGVFREFLHNCAPEVRFLGARELLDLSGRQPTYTLELRVAETPISVESSYIVLAYLKDYFRFIIDGSGALRKYIFEWNVRDYQGSVEVNMDIQRTLEEDSAPEFWWLNNGVTIVASKASITGKVIALDDVQIVNGLQTSVKIHEYVAANPGRDEKRSLLCRIIVTQDDATRDRIIKATNFQTAVPAASLKATTQIQRDIEAYFLSKKWYYDRRKNYYKNLGRDANRIVGIPYLAQAIMAMGLSEPDNSRARPTSLIKGEDNYKRVFDERVELPVYLWAAATMKQVDAFLKSEAAPGAESEKREFRFHLAMWLVVRALGQRTYHPSQLRPLLSESFREDELEAAMQELLGLLESYPHRATRPLDRIAKSRDFVEHLLDAKFGASASTAPTPLPSPS